MANLLKVSNLWFGGALIRFFILIAMAPGALSAGAAQHARYDPTFVARRNLAVHTYAKYLSLSDNTVEENPAVCVAIIGEFRPFFSPHPGKDCQSFEYRDTRTGDRYYTVRVDDMGDEGDFRTKGRMSLPVYSMGTGDTYCTRFDIVELVGAGLSPIRIVAGVHNSKAIVVGGSLAYTVPWPCKKRSN